MPRDARNNIHSNFFHVMIQGINKEYIFEKEIEIKTYLKYLKQKLEHKNLLIISYCIMNNHAHFLVYTKDIMEISKLMSQVNTRYAMFYNKRHDRCGFVFKNRYKSEEILTYSHLISCINYIHNNPVKAKMCKEKGDYKYSSYNEYKDKTFLLNINLVRQILERYNIMISTILDGKYESYKFIEHIEIENKKEKTKRILDEFLKENKIKHIDQIVNNKKYLKKLSNIMYIENGFTQKEIGEILGISRLRIHRIIHEL